MVIYSDMCVKLYYYNVEKCALYHAVFPNYTALDMDQKLNLILNCFI